MIPGISEPNTLIPLDIDADPLVDRLEILSRFAQDNKSQVLHLTQDILKPTVLKMINDRGLEIDKIDVWRWNLTNSRTGVPHTDGQYGNGTGRNVGMNWSLENDGSGVEFFDAALGTQEFEDLIDRSHASWIFPKGTEPTVVWNNRYPSLINTQVPHLVTGADGTFRYSMTIKFKGNPTFDIVATKLWDLRLDSDDWDVPVSNEDWQTIKDEVITIEQKEGVVPNLTTNIISYKLPTELSGKIISVLSRFSKRKVKSLRIFIMKPGFKAGMHIDYDQWLDVIPRYAMNFPLYGCEDSFVEFHRNTGEQGRDSNEATGVGGYLYPKDYSKVFHNSTLYMLTPKLVRIDVPHVVDNFSNHERKILSVRFFEEPGDLPSHII